MTLGCRIVISVADSQRNRLQCRTEAGCCRQIGQHTVFLSCTERQRRLANLLLRLAQLLKIAAILILFQIEGQLLFRLCLWIFLRLRLGNRLRLRNRLGILRLRHNGNSTEFLLQMHHRHGRLAFFRFVQLLQQSLDLGAVRLLRILSRLGKIAGFKIQIGKWRADIVLVAFRQIAALIL